MRVRTMSVKHKHANKLQGYPSFHVTGSIKGMKDKFYGKNALLVRCGRWIYDVSGNETLYYEAKL